MTPLNANSAPSAPAGVTAVVLGDCANLAVLFSLVILRGCTEAAVSAEAVGAHSGAINAILGYEDEAQSATALDLIGQVGLELDGVPLEKIALLQEDSLLKLRIPADIDELESVFDALGIP